MAPRWLYEFDARGLFVASDFMERLRNGDAAALRALQKVDLTTLYRRGYSRRKWWEYDGLFYNSEPPIERIHIARGGRHAPGPWIRDHLRVSDWTTDRRRIDRHMKDAAAELKEMKKAPLPDESLSTSGGPTRKRTVKLGPNKTKYYPAGWEFESYKMKPNPKFELVVVNKHDRAALLKLLSEIDTSPTVEAWLAERTERNGATLSSALFTDYGEWCNANDEVALGRKAFAQALVANGVVKLTRSREGERYELELRPPPRSAGTSRG